MTKHIDLTGQRFGKWKALARGENDKHGFAQWVCECSCGNTAVVCGNNLRHGTSRQCKACGSTTHGLDATPEQTAWEGMFQRCNNPNNKFYHDYGGRGITVCEKWSGEHGLVNFVSDMGNRPDGMSIDRIDNDKGYAPENCRWATPTQQQRNKKNNRLLTARGETKCVSEWAAAVGIKSSAIHWRIHAGWTVEEAVTTPSTRKGNLA